MAPPYNKAVAPVTQVAQVNAREKELEAQLAQAQEQLKQQSGQLFVDSLADEKVFRVNLIASIDRVAEALKDLKSTVVEISSPQAEAA